MKTKNVTIVTGGGRGIGRAIALRMARETAVLVIGRTESDLASVCEQIEASGGEADYLVADIADATTATAAVARAAENGWTIRNLICNAGIAKGGPAIGFNQDTWREMFDVNVHGTFYMIQACLPAMVEKQGGAIVIINSVAGLAGIKRESAYCATKFALRGMAESLAFEHAKNKIKVVSLCPGFVDTDMTERTILGLCNHRGFSRARAEKLLASKNLQGRILQPEEVAEAASFACSALARSGAAYDLTGPQEPRVLQMLNWVRMTFARAKRIVIPVSGGSDSALVFWLCSMVYPEKTLGVFVGKPEQLRCRAFFESKGELVCLQLPAEQNNEIGRWTEFLKLSQELNAWLVGCRNRTEEVTGLFSLVSRVATVLPLQQLWKTEVMELCDLVGIPKEITDSSRKADPDCGRPVEMAEIPLELADTFFKVQEGLLPKSKLRMLTAAQRKYLTRVLEQNHYKRFLPNSGPASLGTHS